MSSLRALTLLPAALLFACTPSDSGTTETGATDTAHTSAPTTGDHHASGETHAHDETAGETHAHASEETHAHDETAGGTPIDDYCFCMLENCHDLYHSTWGEDHEASETMCAAAAAMAPVTGMAAMSGNSLECRMHFCDLGHDVAGACESAMGGAPCQ